MTNYCVKSLISAGLIAVALQPAAAMAQMGMIRPEPVPADLQVPAGNTAYLKAFASGTQNYVCVPGSAGPAWKFLGPQATLFITIPWIQGETRQQQVATHFLSSNPTEGGTARPTWQGSFDTSLVWGKAIASSTDPRYVAPGAIPWLLVEAAGARRGPMGGSTLAQTTFIQRINTAGGIAPTAGCDESVYGKVALVPYTTDYVFYQSDQRR